MSLDTLRRMASNSSDELARYIYGRKLFDRSDDGALDAFLAAEQTLSPASSDPTSEHILAFLGYLLAAHDRDAEASERLTRAQKLNADDTRVHLGLRNNSGCTVGSSTRRRPRFLLVVDTDGNDEEGWYRLGLAYVADNKHSQAVDALQRSLKLQPRDDLACEELGGRVRPVEAVLPGG